MNRNRIRKAQAKKLTAAALAVLMSTQLCAAPITAQAAGSADSDKDKDNTESQKEESKAVGKDETVYVKTDASGNTKDITVSDWLKNTDGTSSIQDASDLTDITNVKGDETYAQEDNGDMLWTSDGSDIYYQGKSNGQLPVDVKITYYLDGQEIAPENLAGKSGKVKIRFDYTNNSKKTVKVNGKEEEIYTPFLMASAMILPGDNFKNVEVSNGKVISDGSNNSVVGIALPGLEDSLKLDELDLGDRDEIPDYVEVTADATDFKLEMTATVASCGNLDEDVYKRQGKTTVSRLAARFWDANRGRITVGGMDISTIDPETLMSLYSIVFQDVTLFNNTIMENIRIGKMDATDEEVLAAARLAHCDEFAEKLSDGWHTMIGENGSELSGGERQRISIARAFLKDAPIILLDEATASLDVDNETMIQESLSRLIQDKTVLIIAHRMRTVTEADQIVVLKDGTVAESGSPAELEQKDGIYANMVKTQLLAGGWNL